MERLIALTLVLFGMTTVPADAAAATTFAGSCVLRGNDVFTPVLTMQPQASTAVADVSGTCKGALTRAGGVTTKFTGTSARLLLRTTSPTLSCAGGALRGSATLYIDGTTVTMNVDEPQLTAVSALLISGPTTGRANGVAYADERTDLVGTVQACLGSGVAAVPITLSFTTLTPIG